MLPVIPVIRMQQAVAVWAAVWAVLVLGTDCSPESQTFCHHLECPDYAVIGQEMGRGFEKRLYPPTCWINTAFRDELQAGEAHRRLTDYCHRHGDAGERISKTWPVLISPTGGGYLLSWFVPPEVSAQNESSVTVTCKPEQIVYVRTFGGVPSLDNGEEVLRLLQEELGLTGSHLGAFYDPPLSFTHHNEVWLWETK